MTRRDWLLFLTLMIAVTLLALPIVTYPLGRDQGEFATIGRGILNGKIPYVDLWNPKPPAVFYVYALAMRVYGPALRVIDLLITPCICAALYWLGWPQLVRFNWRLDGLFLVDDVLIFLPVVVPLVLSWGAFYEVERCLHRTASHRQATAADIPPLATRSQYVQLHVRHYLDRKSVV